jgi:hypothetical protein
MVYSDVPLWPQDKSQGAGDAVSEMLQPYVRIVCPPAVRLPVSVVPLCSAEAGTDAIASPRTEASTTAAVPARLLVEFAIIS